MGDDSEKGNNKDTSDKSILFATSFWATVAGEIRIAVLNDVLTKIDLSALIVHILGAKRR